MFNFTEIPGPSIDPLHLFEMKEISTHSFHFAFVDGKIS